MSNTSDPRGETPIPEGIHPSTQARPTPGAPPRGGDVERSLHEIRNEILERTDSASGSARDAYDDVRGAAGDRADDLSERASDLSDRAAESARDLRDKVRQGYDEARSWASGRYTDQRRRAGDLVGRGYDRYESGREATEDFVSENPLIVGVLGLAAGLLLGALLPGTRRENRALGPLADEARDRGLRYAREATAQGRRFVERTLDPDALDAAVRRGARAGTGHGAGHEPADAGRRGGDYEGPERTAHRL